MKTSLNIAVIHSWPVVRSGFSSILGNCVEFKEPPELLWLLDYDVILVDIHLLNLIKRICNRKKVIAIADSHDPGLWSNALKMGASGVIGINASVHEIEDVVDGTKKITEDMVSKVLDYQNWKVDTVIGYASELSQTELEIFKALATTPSLKLIAERTHLSYGTVRNYIRSIKDKLDCQSLAELAIKSAEVFK